MRESEDVREQIEEGIASRGKLRIVRTLAIEQQRPLSRYVLEKRTGIRSKSLSSDLRILIELGWVLEHKESERIVRYSLNYENEQLGKVLAFLRVVHYLN